MIDFWKRYKHCLFFKKLIKSLPPHPLFKILLSLVKILCEAFNFNVFDRYIGPSILSADIRPFGYRPMCEFELYNDKRYPAADI